MPTPPTSSSTAGVGAGGAGAGVLPLSSTVSLSSLQGLSAHGLVSMDRAEEILQRVIDTVNEQALQISSLYLLLQTLVGGETQQLPSGLLNIEGNFYRLAQRLEQVEKAIHVPGVAPSISIGEVVSTNGVELNHALDALNKKANQGEVLARQQKLEKEVADVYAWAGSRELVERLEETNQATRTQVQAMEASLACKVDKADLAGMESTLSRLKAFNTRMDAVERAQVEEMTTVKREVKELQERTDAATAKLEATQKALANVEEKHGAWRRETLELMKEVEKELAGTASLEQLEKKLDARLWDKQWRVACEHLDKKVDLPEMTALVDKVGGLEETLVRLARESDVYSRFVEWFYARGQAYEHNLQTLDVTLGRLAKESLQKYMAEAGVGPSTRIPLGRRQGGRAQQPRRPQEEEGNEEDREEESIGSDLIFSSSSSSSGESFELRRRGGGEDEETRTLSPV